MAAAQTAVRAVPCGLQQQHHAYLEHACICILHCHFCLRSGHSCCCAYVYLSTCAYLPTAVSAPAGVDLAGAPILPGVCRRGGLHSQRPLYDQPQGEWPPVWPCGCCRCAVLPSGVQLAAQCKHMPGMTVYQHQPTLRYSAARTSTSCTAWCRHTGAWDGGKSVVGQHAHSRLAATQESQSTFTSEGSLWWVWEQPLGPKSDSWCAEAVFHTW
jgi:hypothetical protein